MRLLELSLQNTGAQISEVLCTQTRSQSLRYPCSAERENEVLWVIADNRILVIPVKLRRREVLYQDGVSLLGLLEDF